MDKVSECLDLGIEVIYWVANLSFLLQLHTVAYRYVLSRPSRNMSRFLPEQNASFSLQSLHLLVREVHCAYNVSHAGMLPRVFHYSSELLLCNR